MWLTKKGCKHNFISICCLKTRVPQRQSKKKKDSLLLHSVRNKTVVTMAITKINIKNREIKLKNRNKKNMLIIWQQS